MKSQWGGVYVGRGDKAVCLEGWCHEANIVWITVGLYTAQLRTLLLLGSTESWTVQVTD